MILEILLSSAVRLLLVGAAAWLALRLLLVRNPHVETLVWRMLLVVGLVVPALLYWNLAPKFATSLELPVIAAASGSVAGSAAGAVGEPALPAGIPVTIYMAVALLLSGRLIAGLVAMRRVSRQARPMAMSDDVRVSERIRSPATFGTTILLPAEAQTWPANRLEPVLAHERAHVRGRDGYWSWLAQLHAAIFWFNPLAWWMQRRLEMLAETTSDDAVVAARHDSLAYAELLLDFARHPNSRSVAMSVAESNVPERVERLLARTPPARALPRIARWTGLALLVPVAMLAASTTRAEPPVQNVAPAVQDAQALPVFHGVKLVHPVNPDDYYPAVAVSESVEGSVVVEADVDVLGQLVDARVVKVEPVDQRYGFADAALQVARATRYGNNTDKPGSITFMVRFALDAEPKAAAKTAPQK